jgi:hypothetical protein
MENCQSELDFVIGPDIFNDELYYEILKISGLSEIKNVLEIGSSSGEGSTSAIVKGAKNDTNIYCLEVSKNRFFKLNELYKNRPNVFCYNASSISLLEFPTEADIILFCSNFRTNANNVPLTQLFRCLKRDLDYIVTNNIPAGFIRIIKESRKIDFFDLVIIDGSDFSGLSDFKNTYGAKYFVLDDINGFKNHYNHISLLNDSNYVLVKENIMLRNGYGIFKRVF